MLIPILMKFALGFLFWTYFSDNSIVNLGEVCSAGVLSLNNSPWALPPRPKIIFNVWKTLSQLSCVVWWMFYLHILNYWKILLIGIKFWPEADYLRSSKIAIIIDSMTSAFCEDIPGIWKYLTLEENTSNCDSCQCALISTFNVRHMECRTRTPGHNRDLSCTWFQGLKYRFWHESFQWHLSIVIMTHKNTFCKLSKAREK